jgi:hypothetical protein
VKVKSICLYLEKKEHLRTERNYREGAEEEDRDEGEGRNPKKEA